jgi:hypothetical protein
MTGFIRVKDPATGHEYSLPEGVPLDGRKVLNKPATDAAGLPLPDKPNVPKGRQTIAADPAAPTTEGENNA